MDGDVAKKTLGLPTVAESRGILERMVRERFTRGESVTRAKREKGESHAVGRERRASASAPQARERFTDAERRRREASGR